MECSSKARLVEGTGQPQARGRPHELRTGHELLTRVPYRGPPTSCGNRLHARSCLQKLNACWVMADLAHLAARSPAR